MSRLPDELLDACRCDPAAPFAQDPARDFGLDKQQAHHALQALRPWLNKQQRMLWANRRNALLLLLQGTDCSGKDGLIRRVINSFDPQGVRINGFQKPDECELRHDFLWRYQQRLPEPGRLAVFNRSYYEGLISDPLDGLCSVSELPARRQSIQAFEAQLFAQQITPLKCFLHLSKNEQKLRLQERLAQPHKRWKLHSSDLQSYREFDLRQRRWAEQLSASHSAAAPWYVIPADHRWLRDWLVASLLARELERLQLDWPDAPAPFSLSDLQAL
ncbi:PPK2 family polyphosphate kinase [Pseudomonas sp. TMP9]|uniref:polyphosphate kinase 2 family protein n=1 Tax=Pseudomonas sp. TMP9 TaxID=3133144 RepID=UPI0030D2A80D